MWRPAGKEAGAKAPRVEALPAREGREVLPRSYY